MRIWKGVKRYFKRLRKDAEFRKRKRLSDHRASSLAVKMVLSGALQSMRLSGSALARHHK